MRPHKFALLGAVAFIAACGDSNSTTPVMPPIGTRFNVTPLVADSAGAGTRIVDTNLVNPWGLAFSTNGTLWVSDNHTGRSTLYHPDGSVVATVVAIPSNTDTLSGGSPTGVIFSSGSPFIIPGAGAALFVFASEDGTISAWNASTPHARRVANRSAQSAVYKGIAMDTSAGKPMLFATNFRHNGVDVFDTSFTFVRSFTDSTVPAGYAPFGIANIGGALYITFALRAPPDSMDDLHGSGNGFVDVFASSGKLVRRFASNGPLNSPWAVVQAPSGFGNLVGDILVGNFGDGHITAFDASGHVVSAIVDSAGNPVVIEGLWGLSFGPAAADPTTLFFAAGPRDETQGLLGTIRAR
ncbi:MAG TPA: TIGR03118 family protein [Gemmatimonadales bacterium]|nr:TIGR03118 family protein [Gemmatimonadales bacterium]